MEAQESIQNVQVEIREDLLDSLMGNAAARPAVASLTGVLTPPPVTSPPQAAAPDSPVPSGFYEGFVLSQLVQSRQPVNALVVSIGIISPDTKADHSVSPKVRDLIQSLIGPGDFGCPAGPDEFLLIYPQERGASAQRRLRSIAQQLWDFQLSSPGEAQLLFTWGGIEVRSASMVEAINSASERMQETQRTRKWTKLNALQQAV